MLYEYMRGGNTINSKEKIKEIFFTFFFVLVYTISKKGVLYMSQAVNVNFKLDADVKKEHGTGVF